MNNVRFKAERMVHILREADDAAADFPQNTSS